VKAGFQPNTADNPNSVTPFSTGLFPFDLSRSGSPFNFHANSGLEGRLPEPVLNRRVTPLISTRMAGEVTVEGCSRRPLLRNIYQFATYRSSTAFVAGLPHTA